MSDEKELVQFSRQVSPVVPVPYANELEEVKDIPGMRRVVKSIFCGGFLGRQPIVGKCNWVPCGRGEIAGQSGVICLVFPG